jgi:hypothetical protein
MTARARIAHAKTIVIDAPSRWRVRSRPLRDLRHVQTFHAVVQIAYVRVSESNVMKSSIGTLALRFAATVVLFAPAVTAQAQDIGHSPSAVGNRASTPMSAPPPPPQPAAPEPPVTRTTPSSETVYYDAAAEAQKAQLRATERRDPPSLSLCPPPYRMTARDGCQK